MSKISISMDEETLSRLLSSGALRAAELKCLDCTSKACIWKMVLQNAAKTLNTPESRIIKMLQTVNQCKGFQPQHEGESNPDSNLVMVKLGDTELFE